MNFFSSDGLSSVMLAAEGLADGFAQQAQRLAEVANLDKLHEAQQQQQPPLPTEPQRHAEDERRDSVADPLDPPGHTKRSEPTQAYAGREYSTPASHSWAAASAAVASRTTAPTAAAYPAVAYLPPPSRAYAQEPLQAPIRAPAIDDAAGYASRLSYAHAPEIQSRSAENSADDAFLADLLEAGISLEEARGIRDAAKEPAGPIPGRVQVSSSSGVSASARPPAPPDPTASMFAGAFFAAQAVADQMASATTSTLENVGAAILSTGDAAVTGRGGAAAPATPPATAIAGQLLPPQAALTAAAPGLGLGSLWRTGAPSETLRGSDSSPLSPFASLLAYLPGAVGGSGEGGSDSGVTLRGAPVSSVAQPRNPGSGFISVPGLGSLMSGSIRAPAGANPGGNPALLLAAARAMPRNSVFEAFETGCGIACEPVVGFWVAAVTVTAVILRVVGIAASAALVCCGGARLNAVLRRCLARFTDRQIATVVLALAMLWAAWTTGVLQLAWWVLLKLLRPLLRWFSIDSASVSSAGSALLPAGTAALTTPPLVLARGGGGAALNVAAAAPGAVTPVAHVVGAAQAAPPPAGLAG